MLESEDANKGRWRISVRTLDGLNDLLYALDRHHNANSTHFDLFIKVPGQVVLLDGFSVVRLAHFRTPFAVDILVRQINGGDPHRISAMVEDLAHSWKVEPIKEVVGI